MSDNITLIETNHPDKSAEKIFDSLIGIDDQKDELVSAIVSYFKRDEIAKWKKHYHPNALNFLDRLISEMPLIILSGEVGCGKSALAHSVCTPAGKRLDKRLMCLETPSDIRGHGRVGELSARVTSAFAQAKTKLRSPNIGLLVIDEADDLATSRAQNQAHHEDRAGLNVLIKEIDAIVRDKANILVLLITNRATALDPAILRRASLHLVFKRPGNTERRKIFEYLFNGVPIKDNDLDLLVEASNHQEVGFTYSDLINRIGKQAILRAVKRNEPFTPAIYMHVLKSSAPSPIIKETSILE